MIRIERVTTAGEALQQARTLLTEYLTELDEDLNFQNITDELDNPLLKYGAPHGSLLLAFYNDELAGSVGLRPIPADVPACEMKRLYVRPSFRQLAIGKALALAICEEAVALGYKKMKLDSLERLQAAVNMYTRLGFTFTLPYNESPLEGVVYMERDL
jgi:ribosomal protein S18 acetylase RimI-like enzyme